MHDKRTLIQTWLLPITLVLLTIALSFWDVLKGMYAQWMKNDDFSYGILILPIALYLIWEKRKTITAITPKLDLRGIIIMMGAIGLYILGDLGAELFVRRIAIITLCIGAVWWLYGIRIIRILAFPLAFLFLMLPLPGIIYRNITFSLQIFSSKISVQLLNALGYLAYREGNIIDMGFGQFQVIDACNGLRFIMPMLTLGVLFAFIRPQIWWKRFVLITITVPLAMLTNILRIVGTGILAKYFGNSVAQGFFHDFSGWAVFMVSFFLFGLFAIILKRLPGKAAARVETKVEPSPKSFNLKKQMMATIVAFILCLMSPIAVNVLGSADPVPLKKPLEEFPLNFVGRKGEARQLNAEIWKQVGGESYVIIDFYKAGEPTINFYTAYYEYHRKSGDFIHNPMRCMPAGGWHIVSDKVRTLSYPNSIKTSGYLQFSELLIERSGELQLVYYWFQGRNRNSTNEFIAKFFVVWDGIWRGRTDGALVRLVMPISSEHELNEARSRLDPFALKVYTELYNYLP